MPANPITFELVGLKECQDALKELPKATQRNVQIRALMRQARPIAAAARALAPVRFGHLRDSIIATTQRPHGNKTPAQQAFASTLGGGGSIEDARAAAKAAGSSPVEVFVGPGRMPQSSLQEFGTKNHPPHPYMRPAWDLHQRVALGGIAQDLWDEIQKAVARRAKNESRSSTGP